MSSGEASAITLRALEGEPLADEALEEMIVATARAIAERQGFAVLAVATTPDSITVKIRTGRIQAMGYAVELRRLTTNWYTRKYGERTLWGEPPAGDAEPGEGWNRA